MPGSYFGLMKQLVNACPRLDVVKCRVVGATYANGWLITVGASKTSPVPGNGMRRRHARRRILPRFGVSEEITPLVLLCGVSA